MISFRFDVPFADRFDLVQPLLPIVRHFLYKYDWRTHIGVHMVAANEISVIFLLPNQRKKRGAPRVC